MPRVRETWTARPGTPDVDALLAHPPIEPFAGAFWQVLPIDGQTRQKLTCCDAPGENPADGGHATVVVITEGGDEHLQGSFWVDVRARDVTQNSLKKRLQIGT